MNCETIFKHQCEGYSDTHFNLDELQNLKAKKLIKIGEHPILPLIIINYTSLTQYKKKWTKETLQARGLVVNINNGLIVARPLPKFFNHYELEGIERFEKSGYELYEKMDGSLIIMFMYQDELIFCSRGNFLSVQAKKAEEIFFKKYDRNMIDPNCTYCLEVIYPSNKIVVNYGDIEDLFLIAMIETKTGFEYDISKSGMKTVSQHVINCPIDNLSNLDFQNKEGFVIKFSNNFRMKVKFPKYIMLHKLITISYAEVKKHMMENKSFALESIPDELFKEYETMVEQVKTDYVKLRVKHENEYHQIKKSSSSNTDIVEKIKASPHSKILFSIHNNKLFEFEKNLWKML